MVTFNQVCKHYGTQDVLENVSFEILPGRKIGLIGRNGTGKTTLVRLLVGEEEPSAGTVLTRPGAPGGARSPARGYDPRGDRGGLPARGVPRERSAPAGAGDPAGRAYT